MVQSILHAFTHGFSSIYKKQDRTAVVSPTSEQKVAEPATSTHMICTHEGKVFDQSRSEMQVRLSAEQTSVRNSSIVV